MSSVPGISSDCLAIRPIYRSSMGKLVNGIYEHRAGVSKAHESRRGRVSHAMTRVAWRAKSTITPG